MQKDLRLQFKRTQKQLNEKAQVHNAFIEMHKLMQMFILEIEKKESEMDKSYKKLIKTEKALEKDTKKVLKKDASRDKMVEKAKKMKKGC